VSHVLTKPLILLLPRFGYAIACHRLLASCDMAVTWPQSYRRQASPDFDHSGERRSDSRRPARQLRRQTLRTSTTWKRRSDSPQSARSALHCGACQGARQLRHFAGRFGSIRPTLDLRPRTSPPRGPARSPPLPRAPRHGRAPEPLAPHHHEVRLDPHPNRTLVCGAWRGRSWPI
jgi:hypothetical protein